MIKGLPDEIYIDFEQSIYMKYTLDQTFNDIDYPTYYRNARTTIYYNVTFDNNYRWMVESNFQISVRLTTCGDELLVYPAIFEYIFTNTTKQIQVVIESHLNWPLLNKHPSYYSGINPDNKEAFLLDEMMLLRGGDGMIEYYFDKIGTGNITIDQKTYDTNLFELNTTFSILYSG